MLAVAGKMTLSLAAVLGLMWMIARASRKPLKARAGGQLAVLARQQLSRGTSVAVVKVGDKALVVGVTENQVTLLSEIDLAAMTEALAPVESVSRTPVDLDSEITDEDHAVVTDLDSRRSGALAGSALSPATWKQAIDLLRERTARSS
jgi:flagellar protein FliO/FliZ